MSTDRREREQQWAFLEDSKEQWGPCWLIAGDWNDIVDNEEKRGGVRRRNSSFVGFQEFIINMQMQEVAQLGSFFTWGNNREGDGYVEERLDKIFVSFEWGVKFPNMVASNFYRSTSDHNVLLFDTDKQLERRHKRFQFSSQWANMEGVQDAVKDGWQVEVEGSAMYQVHQKVKHTRMSLLAWHKPVHRNSEKVV
ncbi:non-ltr retroelement reverse transcriptase [Striga asiatica]|uniref:Non-ltr retroelement reverse transcriptase n=1 Tax=Striga asiatica TaxID=4170 RepID=A0A5A7REV4_STRAF|nr:non-ltr retroelement reverse transcriptase [Striga asiatica]